MIDPTLRQVRMVLAIVRHGSFRAAADRLLTSQSSITIQIKELEDRLGVVLFDRTTRVVQLTPAGAELISEFERLAATTDEIKSRCAQISSGYTDQIRIAALPSIAAYFLPKAISKFREEHKTVRIDVTDAIEKELIQAIKLGKCDFGLTSARMVERDMVFDCMFKDELMAVMPSDHCLAKSASVSIADLHEYDIIATKPGTSLRIAVEESFDYEKLVLSPKFEFNYMTTAIAFAAEGMGIALIPSAALHNYVNNKIVARPIQARAGSRALGVLRMNRTSHDPIQNRFIELLFEMATEIYK